MANTRSSQGSNAPSSPPSAVDKTGGTKRKADSGAAEETTKAKPAKQQKTIEETLPATNGKDDGTTTTKEEKHVNGSAKSNGNTDQNGGEGKETEKTEGGVQSNAELPDGAEKVNEKNAFDQVKADDADAGTTSKADNNEKSEPVKGEAVEEDQKREAAMPSNILEKGIIYFFSRGRVTVDNPDSVQDLARSYFVMRPLPDGAKLTDGAIQDVKNNRLIALPKKVWPKSGKDRFMAFVEKTGVGMDTLKEEFFSGSDYSTKTTGTRHTPEVTPMGEGVYAMTTTGGGQGTTHLAYMLTIPSEVGEVQQDLGLSKKGSFVLSLKNPEASGPANAQLPKGADYPKEIIDEFRGRGWMPAEPKHLNYEMAQVLLIGEDFDSSSNLEPAPKDEKNSEKETPQEELEKLEGEDEHRVERLKGDDSVFADLGISSEDYPKVPTTW